MDTNVQINTTQKKLVIIHINVNSLIRINKRYDLDQFLKKHNPDILLINETKLNSKHKIQFENYHLIRKDRLGNTQGGGTAILIRKNLKHSYYTNGTINSFHILETCILKVFLSSNKLLYIISAYYPSGNNDTFFRKEIHELFESMNLHDENNYYILAGDLNAKHSEWGNSINNQKGKLLNDWLMDNDILFRCKLYATCSPSFPRAGSYIDICISDCRLHIVTENNTINSLKILEYDSDHEAVQIIASLNKEEENFTIFLQNDEFNLDYKSTNWRRFQNIITQRINQDLIIPNNRNLLNSEIEYHIDRLNNIITDTINEIVPKHKIDNRFSKITNATTKMLHREKSKLLNLIKRHNRLELTLSDEDYAITKTKLKLVKKLMNDNLNNIINKQLQEKLTNIDPKDSINMFKQIRKNFRKYTPLNLGILKISENSEQLLINAGINPQNLRKDNSNNYLIEEETQMLNTIGTFFESIHASKSIIQDNSTHQQINRTFNCFLNKKRNFESNKTTYTTFNDTLLSDNISELQKQNVFITKNELSYIFKNLKSKLSSGIDSIPNIVLKNIPQSLLNEYCKLFNNLLNNSYFPNNWKTAKTVILPKKGKEPDNPKNLRPISLLPNISKIFEICINRNICQFCDEYNIKNDKQFGFKFKHSTTNAIHKLTSDINWNWHRNYCTGACLIDMEKAFDSIWIAGLIFKLIQLDFPLNQIILIYNMISGKEFTIHYKKYRSDKAFKIINGLQQGTVNSPTLFNLYILDLINKVDNIISFADDIIVYHPDDRIENININLQRMYNIVENYTITWNMKINTQKCETILFRPPVNKCNHNIRTNWRKFGIKSFVSNCNIPNKDVSLFFIFMSFGLI